MLNSGLYAWVRHPIYFAWIIVVWMPPTMTGTRLLFAAVSTLYLALAVPFEERDLVRTFGASYETLSPRGPLAHAAGNLLTIWNWEFAMVIED